MAQAEQDFASGFGPLLKFWRGVHGLSQETLALCAESSTRHISCLENGKAHPSRLMVERLAEVMELGDRDSCYLLLAAGYMPIAQTVDFYSPQYNWLRKAMVLTLKAMDPFPAALMDRYGQLLMVNKGWVSLYRLTVDEAKLHKVRNHYEFMFNQQHSDDISELSKNTMSLILMAMHQEALLSGDENYEVMLAPLLNHPDTPPDWKKRAADLEPQASFKVQVELNGTRQAFYSVSQMVGAMGPTSFISEPRLIINTLYPENTDIDLQPIFNPQLTHPLLPY